MIIGDLETQRTWGWQAVVYLFLAGVGSGSLMAGLVSGYVYREATIAKLGLAMGPPLLIMGSLSLLLDLGRPMLSFLAPKRPKASWISKGFIILLASIIVGFVQIGLWIWPWPVISNFSTGWKLLGTVNGVLALLISLYPALLLGHSPIPLWNTSMLPVLFSVSSLSTGVAALNLGAKLSGIDDSLKGFQFLHSSGTGLIVLEMILLGLYLYGMKLVSAARESVGSILRGRWAGRFWVGLIGIGLVIPLISGIVWGETVASWFCILIGGYMIRDVVIRAGMKMPLMAQGSMIPIPGKN